MMFFSTASWKRGGGGKSTARNRKGDVVAFISAKRRCEVLLHGYETQGHASVNVKYWFLVFRCIGTNDDLLSLRTDLSLKGGEDNTCSITRYSSVSNSFRIPGLTRVFLLVAPQIPV
jgi:hypothetical protein